MKLSPRLSSETWVSEQQQLNSHAEQRAVPPCGGGRGGSLIQTNMGNRVQLTPEQAEAMLADGDFIHTFVNAGPVLVGADWERENVLKRFRDKEAQPPELSGQMARSMNHGVCFYDTDHWVFVATKEAVSEPVQ